MKPEEAFAASSFREQAMFFMIRAAFWLTLVLLLIPGDPNNGFEPPRVGIGEAFAAAGATVADISGFCSRNPETCATGGNALQVLGDKASNGARMLYDFLKDQFEGEPSNPQAAGTLTPEELDVPWLGPPPGGDV